MPIVNVTKNVGSLNYLIMVKTFLQRQFKELWNVILQAIFYNPNNNLTNFHYKYKSM